MTDETAGTPDPATPPASQTTPPASQTNPPATTPTGTRRPPVREDRAATTFTILGVWVTIIGTTALAGSTDQPAIERIGALILVILLATTAFLMAYGTRLRLSWALAALVPVLAITIVAGIVDVVVALTQGRLELPLGVLLAWWTLRAKRDSPLPSGSWPVPAIALVGLFVVGAIAPWLGPLLTAPGGPLIVGQADLAPSLTVECGSAASGVPDSVAATYRWSWHRTELFPGSTDMVVVGWTGADDANPDPTANALFILGTDDTPSNQAGVWSGGGSPSQALADTFAARFARFGSWSWGIDLATQRMASGEIRVMLRRATAGPVAHGTLTVQGAYIHLGRWINSDAESTCSW
jgi:hypothetical protein